MIQVVDGESEIVMISTETNFKLLGQDVHLFGDGTFQFAQSSFTSSTLSTPTRMDSIFHACTFCCHLRPSNAIKACFVI